MLALAPPAIDAARGRVSDQKDDEGAVDGLLVPYRDTPSDENRMKVP